jgi:hypothetical protein
MPSTEQLMAVAFNCSDYSPVISSVTSSMNSDISCATCANYKNNKCVIDVFDKVLSGLDQT